MVEIFYKVSVRIFYKVSVKIFYKVSLHIFYKVYVKILRYFTKYQLLLNGVSRTRRIFTHSQYLTLDCIFLGGEFIF